MLASQRTPLYVDVTNTWASDLQTGMQKVVRQLASVWHAQEFDCHFVIYQNGNYLLLPDTSLEEIKITYSERNSGSINRKVIWNRIRQSLHRVVIKMPRIKSMGFLQSDFALHARKLLDTIPGVEKLDVIELEGINLLILEIVFDSEHVNLIIDLAKNKNISLTFFSYDLIPINHPEFNSSDFIKIYQKYMEISLFSKNLWSISDTTQTELETYVQNSKHTNKSIYQWLPASQYTKCEHGLPFQIAGESAYLLFVSSFEKRKNHLGFLDALRILKLQGIEIPKIVFVGGTGWDETGILEGIKNLSSDGLELVRLLNIPECCVGNLYQYALLTVYPSHFEGFGLPVVESLSYGVPVLTSNIGSTGELLKIPGTLGFEAGNSNDMAEKLRIFLTNKDMQQELQAAAVSSKNAVGNWTEFGRKLYEFATTE